MNIIHPTAIVSGKARLGKNITVNAYAIIEDDVEIGNDSMIGPQAVIYDGARIGEQVKIMQGASVSNIPQDLKYANEKSLFYIGDGTVVREFTTLHRGTAETGFSRVGKNCLLMAYAHVAHDAVLGDNCIIANSVQMGGFVKMGDYVIIGGNSSVHQFCKLGDHSMVGGGYRITKDIPPYILAGNEPLRYAGINIVGLKRRGYSNEDIETLKKAYHILYESGLNITEAKLKMREVYKHNKLVQNILKFLDESDRGIIRK